MPPAFYQAALSTPVGQTSNPVKTQYGYHLIKVLDRKFAVDFESARARIESILNEAHDNAVIQKAVDSRLGAPPVIDWKKVKLLYRAKPVPAKVLG